MLYCDADDNELDRLYRNSKVNSDYEAFRRQLEDKNETTVSYILKERLKWLDLTPDSQVLFTNPNDTKILTNDFPYNFEPDVMHLCVWSKVPIRSDPTSGSGDLSRATRCAIDRYVEKTFIEQLNLRKENIAWFRNFPSLQSVKDLSHIHVLIKTSFEIADTLSSLLFTAGDLLIDQDLERCGISQLTGTN